MHPQGSHSEHGISLAAPLSSTILEPAQRGMAKAIRLEIGSVTVDLYAYAGVTPYSTFEAAMKSPDVANHAIVRQTVTLRRGDSLWVQFYFRLGFALTPAPSRRWIAPGVFTRFVTGTVSVYSWSAFYMLESLWRSNYSWRLSKGMPDVKDSDTEAFGVLVEHLSRRKYGELLYHKMQTARLTVWARCIQAFACRPARLS